MTPEGMKTTKLEQILLNGNNICIVSLFTSSDSVFSFNFSIFILLLDQNYSLEIHLICLTDFLSARVACTRRRVRVFPLSSYPPKNAVFHFFADSVFLFSAGRNQRQ